MSAQAEHSKTDLFSTKWLGLRNDQEEEPWWLTRIRSWVLMAKALMESGKPEWEKMAQYVIESQHPKEMYEQYRSYCAARQAE